ncbi:MAG: 50S ribosomal protein L6 [Bacillota bacterium]
MSRMGNVPVEIPEKVEVDLDKENSTITIKGPKGELTQKYNSRCTINIEDNQILIQRASDNKYDRSLHGMVRSNIVNMVEGVVDGFEKKLEMIGVGYGAQVKGRNLEIEVGFSHPVTVEAPEDIEFEVENGPRDIQALITVKGIDKQKVGEVAAEIREIRKPEPYKGKGIRYQGEQVRRKVGKTG